MAVSQAVATGREVQQGHRAAGHLQPLRIERHRSQRTVAPRIDQMAGPKVARIESIGDREAFGYGTSEDRSSRFTSSMIFA